MVNATRQLSPKSYSNLSNAWQLTSTVTTSSRPLQRAAPGIKSSLLYYKLNEKKLQYIANNPIIHDWTKHVEMDCIFVHDRTCYLQIKFAIIHQHHIVDFLTKSLNAQPMTFWSSSQGKDEIFKLCLFFSKKMYVYACSSTCVAQTLPSNKTHKVLYRYSSWVPTNRKKKKK